MNPDRRAKFKRWFYGALLPSKSRYGVVRIVGTILHEDSLLNSFMPKEYDRWTRRNQLKMWSEKPGPWLGMKYRAHNENFSEILWASRYDQEYFERIQEDFAAQGIPDVYSQEYLNEPIDESVAFFRKADFLNMSKDDKQTQMHWYISGDLAISDKERADYSVFVVASMDEHRTLYIRDVIRDRLDGREIVDTILSLQRIYQPELIGLEEMQVSKAIGPFLREEMVKTGTFPSMLPLKHKGKDKIARARSIQARLRAHGVKFDKEGSWYQKFEEELCKFPRGTHDDQVDSFAYLGMMLDSLVEAPTKQEFEDELYYEELAESEAGDNGRSEVCGY